MNSKHSHCVIFIVCNCASLVFAGTGHGFSAQVSTRRRDCRRARRCDGPQRFVRGLSADARHHIPCLCAAHAALCTLKKLGSDQ